MHQTSPRKSSHTSSHSCKPTNPVRERTTRCPWLLHLCLTRTSRILQLIFRQSRSMSSRCRVHSNYRNPGTDIPLPTHCRRADYTDLLRKPPDTSPHREHSSMA